jgi:hypothetical protein
MGMKFFVAIKHWRSNQFMYLENIALKKRAEQVFCAL